MRFYYLSPFSLIFIALLYALVLGVFWFVWAKLLKRDFSGPVVWTTVAVVLVAPWAEELWIAYQFGQLCRRDAGKFINKTVEVEGFYDETHTWSSRRMNDPGEPKYQFVEGRGTSAGKDSYWRHERLGGEIRSSRIDRPTARYQYRWPHKHTRVAHKVSKIERVVIDSQTNEVLARETKYAREPNWFFIHLSRPVMLCPEPGEHPLEKYGAVYNSALKPMAKGK